MELEFLAGLAPWAKGVILAQSAMIIALWRELVKANREKAAYMSKLLGMIGSRQTQEPTDLNEN